MKRVAYHMTDQQSDRLKALAQQTGLRVADLIRRAVDAYLEDNARGTTKRGGQHGE